MVFSVRTLNPSSRNFVRRPVRPVTTLLHLEPAVYRREAFS
jgi:hypothetical protein